MSKLNDLLQRKYKLSEPTEFISYIDGLNDPLEKSMIEFIESMDFSNGRFVQNETNRKKLIELRKYLLDKLEDGYNVKLEAYLKKFDEVFQVNSDIQLGFGYKMATTDTEFLMARKLATDYATEYLALPKLVDNSIRPGIQRLLFENVIGKASRKTTLNALVDFLGTNQTTARYAGTIARDSISSYDGAIQMRLKEKFKYDGYYYGGTIIETSRAQCRHWVEDLGGFISFEQLKKDIPKYKDNSGYSDELELTFDNFPIVKGGHNCRHSVTLGLKP